ncbi:hypothetical protein AA0111_g2580 [Alternaria arborescens]|uniref:hypothetical protein n=1 Tax=Alternaria arborescens TaxID=156630 RepID=UPI0010755713|nr:hypothetical protein AA0111_g2580 [Alternaria arborescens]RYO37643.1 hypothetical protein AA0111_g2580 [Alternaria arborescens]
MVYVNESIAHSQSRFALRENATFSGGLVHKYITGTMYAIYMLSRICFGLDALSSVAPEMTVESPGLRESDEGSSAQQPLHTHKDRLTIPTMIAFCIALMLYAVTVIVTGEALRSADSSQPHYDGRLDITNSILITSSEAASESLAFWMKILLIVLSVMTEGFVLHAASRKLYWMAVQCSGRTDGTSHSNNGSIRLGYLWSLLSSKSKSYEPLPSVMSLMLLPITLILVVRFYPSALVDILLFVQDFLCSGTLILCMVQAIVNVGFAKSIRKHPKVYVRAGMLESTLPNHENDQYTLPCAHIALISYFLILIGGQYARYCDHPTTLQILSSAVMAITFACAYISTRKFHHVTADQKAGMHSSDSEITERLVTKMCGARTGRYAEF